MKTIYYCVPDVCGDSWFKLEVDYPLFEGGFQDFIADDAAEDFGNEGENLQGWIGKDAIRFDFADTEGGPILFSRMIIAEPSVSYHVYEVPDAESPE